MALSRAHTSAKAAGVSQLLLLIRRRVTHIHSRGVFSGVCLGPHLTLTVTLRDSDYHQNLVVFEINLLIKINSIN